MYLRICICEARAIIAEHIWTVVLITPVIFTFLHVKTTGTKIRCCQLINIRLMGCTIHGVCRFLLSAALFTFLLPEFFSQLPLNGLTDLGLLVLAGVFSSTVFLRCHFVSRVWREKKGVK